MPQVLISTEKIEFLKTMLGQLSFATLKTIYEEERKMSPKARSSKELIEKLIEEVEWTEEKIKHLNNIINETKELERWKTIYVLKLNSLNEDELHDLIGRLQQNEAVISSNLLEMREGFKIIEPPTDETKKITFESWHLSVKKVLSDDMKVVKIPEPTRAVITIDHEGLVLVEAPKFTTFQKSRKSLNKTLGLTFAEPSIVGVDMVDDANDAFRSFISELKSLVQDTNTGSYKDTPLVIKKVYVYMRHSRDEVMQDIREIDVDGTTDIFNHPQVEEFIDKGGKIIGLSGKIRYNDREYNFLVKYKEEAVSSINYGTVKIKKSGRSEISKRELQEVLDTILKVFKKHIYN